MVSLMYYVAFVGGTDYLPIMHYIASVGGTNHALGCVRWWYQTFTRLHLLVVPIMHWVAIL